MSEFMDVPFNDLVANNSFDNRVIWSLVEQKLAQADFIGGASVKEFEQAFASLSCVPHAVACGNGTDALEVCFRLLDLKPGDEVIVPSQTWISTAEAVTTAGGIPIFCDTMANVDQLIDLSQVPDLVTEKTVGIVPVHLYGKAVDMTQLCHIADNHKLWVVEDCAQAHFAQHDGECVGSFGRFGTYSFYPGKNLGGIGDGGAVVCKSTSDYEKVTRLARHGGMRKGEHLLEGRNSRLDSIQAVVLLEKLKYIISWSHRRREIAATYSNSLCQIGQLELPSANFDSDDMDHVFHLFVIACDERDKLATFLENCGVATGLHYRKCLADLPCYKDKSTEHIVNARKYQERILSLPIFPEMTQDQVFHVIRSVKLFYGE